MNDIKVSFLVLDFKKPEETVNCLYSIKEHALFPHRTIYLDNGSNENYPWSIYEDNLCDILIRNKIGTGCGNGTQQLFESCDTEWAIYWQNDQTLIRDLYDKDIEYFIDLIENKGYGCVDLAGAQNGVNNYSERAQFINVDFYKKIYKGEKGQLGGPGVFNHKKYTEAFVSEHFKANNLNIAHLQPTIAKDCGKWSIRAIGDGLYKWRCDTKQTYILKTPTYPTELWPPFNSEEWSKVITGQWVDGDIIEEWKKHSFRCWPD